ncbi:DUF5318 domain-containing protein [Actinoplanes sp. TBRC 11911]|uniref:DUF5318 family protein n=1 Tax=Actinoplanes sp. TBRC 11911 TaxID=2729386 RepID=UPI00145DCF23|nr:DUF5318 family protein [Actinoplanes sp. TBRC 11911]NMO49962.1 DUF5318 domain-containing protein [Actinoplanes sp. TBRC 11911]
MRIQWQVVDYSLQNRAVPRDLHTSRIGTVEPDDISTHLKTAAVPPDKRNPAVLRLWRRRRERHQVSSRVRPYDRGVTA